MIIVGYGYADCLLGGAIVALKEKEEGRGTELRFSSMNGLAGVLAGVLLQEKRPGVIYLVGIGLGRNSRLLAEKIESLGKELILFQEIGVCRIFSSCLDRIPTLL